MRAGWLFADRNSREQQHYEGPDSEEACQQDRFAGPLAMDLPLFAAVFVVSKEAKAAKLRSCWARSQLHMRTSQCKSTSNEGLKPKRQLLRKANLMNSAGEYCRRVPGSRAIVIEGPIIADRIAVSLA